MSENDEPLSEQQRDFVDEFMVDGNANRAAGAAGYTPRLAPTLLDMPEVKKEIERRQVEKAAAESNKPQPDIRALIAEAEEARRIAVEANNPSAAVSAVTL